MSSAPSGANQVSPALPRTVELKVENETRRAILDVADAEDHGFRVLTFRKNRSGQGSIMVQIDRNWHSLKRVILGLHGRARGTVVYHKNADPFDLRRENLVTGSLRAACNNANLPNKKGRLYIGVSRTKSGYAANIRVGTYPTELEAAAAYNAAARKLGLPEDAMNVLPIPEANVLGMFTDENSSPDELDEPLEFEV